LGYKLNICSRQSVSGRPKSVPRSTPPLRGLTNDFAFSRGWRPWLNYVAPAGAYARRLHRVSPRDFRNTYVTASCRSCFRRESPSFSHGRWSLGEAFAFDVGRPEKVGLRGPARPQCTGAACPQLPLKSQASPLKPKNQESPEKTCRQFLAVCDVLPSDVHRREERTPARLFWAHLGLDYVAGAGGGAVVGAGAGAGAGVP